jgi:hypothetical protein
MFQAAPWADALFAMDAPWWNVYRDEVMAKFRGERFSAGRRPDTTPTPAPTFGNSGAGALALAAHFGALRIVMVGYDCQRTGGMTHSHGDHPPTLGNAKTMPAWPAKFERAAAHLSKLGVEAINASRATALRCFRRGDLQTELEKP